MATANAMFTITDVGDLNGRNLVLNSHEEHRRTVSSSGAPGVVPYYSYSDFASEFTHRTGQILTVSFDYETVGNTLSTGLIYAQHNDIPIAPTAGSRFVFILDNPSGHYSKTFQVSTDQSTSPKNAIRVFYKTCSPGTVIKIKNIKVETGDEETPWTPAPEDVNTALDDAKEAKELANTKNSVYYQATAPTGNLKDGDTWFDTDNDYKISRWNAGTQEWVAAELGDAAFANIDASKIIAGSVMGNIVLGGTIQAGGSDVGQDGKVLVKDVNDVKVASLSKDGLVATAGTIGGWSIDETSLTLSVPYTYDNSGDQVIAHGDGTDLIQAEDVQLVGNSEDDDANISLITLGRDLSDSIPYILCDDGTLDGTQVRIKNGKISCLKNDNTLTNGISTYIQSDSVVLSESITTDGVTEVNNVRLDTDRVQVLYTPDYEHRDSGIAKRAVLRYNDIAFRGDSANPQLASGIAHWSVLAARRTIKDELGVTIYHCGNLFWAHFDGKMTVGWASRMEEYISIVPNDDASFTNSKLCAPPERLEKYCLPQSPANPRAIYRVFPDGQLGLYHFIPPTNGTNNYEVLTYDNWEPCDIFWAHIG